MKRSIAERDIMPVIMLALREDIGDGDITSEAVFREPRVGAAEIVAKADGVFCGGEVLRCVYRHVDEQVSVDILANDGDLVGPGDAVARLGGSVKSLLIGERTALNFLQRMSGIASATRRITSLLRGTGITVLDTRKTLPGFRLLDKYAVRTGGGGNHRFGLFDAVLIKDNHIDAAGGITEAVRRVRDAYGDRFTVEVEARDPEQATEAAALGVDVIMLDNMDKEAMRIAIDGIAGRAKIEVSGNLDEDRIGRLVDLGIDYFSIGALTHSVKAFDLSMRIVR